MIRERIFVSYRPIKVIGKLAYHMTLNYIDSKGNHHLIDAGPSNPITQNAFGHLVKEELISKNSNNLDSAFHNLVLYDQDSEVLSAQKRATYKGGKILGPYTMIKSGNNLSELWSDMGKTAAWLNGRFEYRPLSQNSNMFVGHILRTHGFINNLRRVYDPNDKSIKNLNIPGAYQIPKASFDDDIRAYIGPEHFKSYKKSTIILEPKKLPVPKPDEFNQKEMAPDVFEKYFDIKEAQKDKPEATKPSVATRPLTDKTIAPDVTTSKKLPLKGPERVDADPSYNPFHRDHNGFEDLEGEVHI